MCIMLSTPVRCRECLELLSGEYPGYYHSELTGNCAVRAVVDGEPTLWLMGFYDSDTLYPHDAEICASALVGGEVLLVYGAPA